MSTVRPKYELLEKQRQFVQSRELFKLYAGGMGSGKTAAGAALAIELSLAYPKNFGLVGRMTYPELKDSTMKEVLEFPVVVDGKDATLIDSPLVARFNSADKRLVFKNGSVIIFRALEDSFGKIKSLNLGWFWIDELTECPKEIWLGLVGRRRRHIIPYRPGFGTTNPEGHDWVWQQWVMNNDPDYFLVQASSEENPHLPADYIPTLKKNYPEEWVKRYVLGSFDTFEGLIYKEFQDREPYVVKAFEIPEDWYRFVSLDYGYRNPTAALWGAVDPNGKVYIYDEYYVSGKLVSENAEIIKAKTGESEIQLYLIDPSCKNRDGKTGRSIIDEYLDNGLYFTPANNDVRAGINRVKEYLKEPNLMVFNTCINLRQEMQIYKWKDIKPGQEGGSKEKPSKVNDHACDALRYLINYLYERPDMKKPSRAFDYKRMLRRYYQQDTTNWMAA